MPAVTVDIAKLRVLDAAMQYYDAMLEFERTEGDTQKKIDAAHDELRKSCRQFRRVVRANGKKKFKW